MNLPRNSTTGYADFHKKFINQFAGSKHVEVTATTLFGICQGYNENLREYLARFSDATIKVSNPNQEMARKAMQKREIETQGKSPQIGDRQKDIREEETSRTAGTKVGEVDAPTSSRGTVAQEHTGWKKNIHA
ncbi:hypothetical protein A2U01_0045785 [Trifolium medium]|uniref:Retrotransposon gag domain-containing protein n=1 Tax=Trifolium medium TaxID=97028 RepID=A0A392QLQ9_9FABA|nr:hypothetical protein [Trifolium medium]